MDEEVELELWVGPDGGWNEAGGFCGLAGAPKPEDCWLDFGVNLLCAAELLVAPCVLLTAPLWLAGALSFSLGILAWLRSSSQDPMVAAR